MRSYLAALRPHQWLKNTLVALPTIADHTFHPRPVLVAFCCFCMAASAVYLLNDCFDLEHDRMHPEKKLRPLAAGQISVPDAVIGGFVLAIFSITTTCFFSYRLGFVVAGYIVLSLAYSLVFKRFVMLDVVTLAVLYGMRVTGGAVITGTPLSQWLIAFCFFLFLSLGLMKRITELMNVETISGRSYDGNDLQVLSGLCSAAGLVSVLVLGLYINSTDVMQFYHRPQILWGICIVMAAWIGRACLIAGRGNMHHDPVIFASTDLGSLVAGILVVTLYIGATI
jgi:4-hydroxybenzoate polyprenyltransferase